MNQKEHARLMAGLHVKGDPLILFNIWDAGSAKALQDVGAKAIATGSWSVAAAHGFGDGEKIPLDLVLANLRRIVAAVDLPITLDFEGGYGMTPAEVEKSVAQVIAAGAVGINFEDGNIGGEGIRSVDDQCARISAAHAAADDAGVPLYINARTDVFLQPGHDGYDELDLEETLRRSASYAKAGASGLFAPGLRSERLIERLCAESSMPVNIVMLPGVPPPRRLAELGVARISYGPGPYRQMIGALKDAASKALAW